MSPPQSSESSQRMGSSFAGQVPAGTHTDAWVWLWLVAQHSMLGSGHAPFPQQTVFGDGQPRSTPPVPPAPPALPPCPLPPDPLPPDPPPLMPEPAAPVAAVDGAATEPPSPRAPALAPIPVEPPPPPVGGAASNTTPHATAEISIATAALPRQSATMGAYHHSRRPYHHGRRRSAAEAGIDPLLSSRCATSLRRTSRRSS